MESSIGNVENTDFPAVRDQRLSVWMLQQNMAKWGQLNNIPDSDLFIYSRFLNTPHVNTNGWETTKKSYGQSQLLPYLRFIIK